MEDQLTYDDVMSYDHDGLAWAAQLGARRAAHYYGHPAEAPAPLSGEWADDPTPRSLTWDVIGRAFGSEWDTLSVDDLSDIETAVADAYEAGYYGRLSGDFKACVIERARLTGQPICVDCGTDCPCMVCLN